MNHPSPDIVAFECVVVKDHLLFVLKFFNSRSPRTELNLNNQEVIMSHIIIIISHILRVAKDEDFTFPLKMRR